MGESHTIHLPLTEDRARELRLGDTVYLDGEIVITSGLPTFQRMMEHIESGRRLPVDLTNGVLLHLVGYNSEVKGEHQVLYLNPTTSTRFNSHMPAIIRAFHLRAVGGKGGLGMESVRAMKEAGCVYLAFPGGGSPLLSASIRECVSVGWKDLIAHYRLVRLRVEALGPAVVAIDAHGNSMYEKVRARMEQGFTRILEDLRASAPNPSLLSDK